MEGIPGKGRGDFLSSESGVQALGQLLRPEIQAILDLQLADNCKAWDMQPDGTYVQRHPAADEELRCSQDLLMQRSLERAGRIGAAAPV